MKRVVLLFPGQGSQLVGMSKSFLQDFRCVRNIYQNVDDALKFSLSKLVIEGPQEELNKTMFAQPALLAHSCSVFAALENELDLNRCVVGAVGHSLGEFSAAAVGGCFSIEVGAKIVNRRGQYMQDASDRAIIKPDEPAMAAFFPINAINAKALCDKVTNTGTSTEICQIANVNSNDQIVLSGNLSGLKRAKGLSREFGAKRVTFLPVSAPFHSSVMKSVKADLKSYFDQNVEINDSRIPLVSNFDMTAIRSAEDVSRSLVSQTDSPVLFFDCIKRCLQDENLKPDLFLEIGANVLTPLVRRIISKSPTNLVPGAFSVSSSEEITKLKDILSR